jgi:hypothetical protein
VAGYINWMLKCRDDEARWGTVVLPGQVASGWWLVVVVVLMV